MPIVWALTIGAGVVLANVLGVVVGQAIGRALKARRNRWADPVVKLNPHGGRYQLGESEEVWIIVSTISRRDRNDGSTVELVLVPELERMAAHTSIMHEGRGQA